MSAVRNAALLGRPMGVPTMASTSSGVRPSVSIWWMPALMACAPMRLPMKFVVSFATTTPLPSTSAPKDFTRANAAGSVSAPGTSSRSFM